MLCVYIYIYIYTYVCIYIYIYIYIMCMYTAPRSTMPRPGSARSRRPNMIVYLVINEILSNTCIHIYH